MQKNNLDLENVLPNDELYWNFASTLDQQTQNSAFLNVAPPFFPEISYLNERQNENVNTDNSSNSNDENNTHNDKRRYDLSEALMMTD